MHLIKHAHLGDRKIENQKEDDSRPMLHGCISQIYLFTWSFKYWHFWTSTAELVLIEKHMNLVQQTQIFYFDPGIVVDMEIWKQIRETFSWDAHI